MSGYHFVRQTDHLQTKKSSTRATSRTTEDSTILSSPGHLQGLGLTARPRELAGAAPQRLFSNWPTTHKTCPQENQWQSNYAGKQSPSRMPLLYFARTQACLMEQTAVICRSKNCNCEKTTLPLNTQHGPLRSPGCEKLKKYCINTARLKIL